MNINFLASDFNENTGAYEKTVQIDGAKFRIRYTPANGTELPTDPAFKDAVNKMAEIAKKTFALSPDI